MNGGKIMDLPQKCSLKKATETEAYFDRLLEDLGNTKIKSVFSPIISFKNYDPKHRTYDCDTLFVIFENSKCLVIEFQYVDALTLQYREMTQAEKAVFDECKIKDLFDNTIQITDYKTGEISETLLISLEYDALKDVEVRRRTDPYYVWGEDEIEEKYPEAETFDGLTFHMKNGNTLVIYPGDVTDGGTMYFCSPDSVEERRK